MNKQILISLPEQEAEVLAELLQLIALNIESSRLRIDGTEKDPLYAKISRDVSVALFNQMRPQTPDGFYE